MFLNIYFYFGLSPLFLSYQIITIMDDTLFVLKEKEKQLREQLESTDLYKQWEAIVRTISIFEKPSKVEVLSDIFFSDNKTSDSPYDSNWTWQEKVLYVLTYKLDSGYVTDIIEKIKEVDSEKDEETILNRVRWAVSVLVNKERKLRIVQKSGKRIKVALKK